MLIIQHIHFKWDKSFRGSAGADYLNKLRNPVPLPDYDFANHGTFVHSVNPMEDGSGIIQSFENIVEDYWSLQFKKSNKYLDVFFHFNLIKHGMPDRTMSNKQIMMLKLGEQGEFRINGRHLGSQTDYEQHYYTQDIIYLANISEPTDGLFNQEHIDKKVDLNRKLF